MLAEAIEGEIDDDREEADDERALQHIGRVEAGEAEDDREAERLRADRVG